MGLDFQIEIFERFLELSVKSDLVYVRQRLNDLLKQLVGEDLFDVVDVVLVDALSLQIVDKLGHELEETAGSGAGLVLGDVGEEMEGNEHHLNLVDQQHGQLVRTVTVSQSGQPDHFVDVSDGLLDDELLISQTVVRCDQVVLEAIHGEVWILL